MKIDKILTVIAFISGLFALCGIIMGIWGYPEIGYKIRRTSISVIGFCAISIVINGLSKFK